MPLTFAFWIVVFLYAAALVAMLSLAIWLPKTWRPKVIAAAVVLAIFAIPPSIYVGQVLAQERAEVARKAEQQKYRDAAWAHFKKRCNEAAGEKIFRTVDNVDGLLLLKPRRRATDQELRDQNWKGDPYGYDGYGTYEIASYLSDLNDKNMPVVIQTSRPGFSFVETLETAGVAHHRLRHPGEQPDTTQVDKSQARYGVTWEDISTPEDRSFWVAGGMLQIIDLASKQIIAERIGFLIEGGFGSQAQGRVSWQAARFTYAEAACPPIHRNTPTNRLFVEKVLKPGRGGANAK